jgi:hypothetical protein
MSCHATIGRLKGIYDFLVDEASDALSFISMKMILEMNCGVFWGL